MIPFYRSLGITQMLANGAEGYRAVGKYDTAASTTYPFNNWLNDGRKGACAYPPKALRRNALSQACESRS